MIDALLNGKLSPSQENMEDVLTSCVFGAFQHMAPDDGIGRFLQEARGASVEDRPLNDLVIVETPKYTFWPTWVREGLQNCEPDVVLSLKDQVGGIWTVLIEVKFRSGKSAYADSNTDHPTDQLAKEWDHLVRNETYSSSRTVLVYVTSDAIYPRSEIECARQEYDEKRSGTDGYVPFQCYWISWRSLYRILDKVNCTIGRDVRRLALKFGFQEFDGFKTPIAQSTTNWRFDLSYTWCLGGVQKTEWRYGR
jgi:hypothetical protein